MHWGRRNHLQILYVVFSQRDCVLFLSFEGNWQVELFVGRGVRLFVETSGFPLALWTASWSVLIYCFQNGRDIFEAEVFKLFTQVQETFVFLSSSGSVDQAWRLISLWGEKVVGRAWRCNFGHFLVGLFQRPDLLEQDLLFIQGGSDLSLQVSGTVFEGVNLGSEHADFIKKLRIFLS